MENELILSSTRSTQISLEAVRSGKAGLNSHRQGMLERVPGQGDWARFDLDSIELKDLAYLSAKSGDEFALLRGKREDILFHGEHGRCRFKDILVDLLNDHKLEIIGHAHPGEDIPEPSSDDRKVLKEIGQSQSRIISARTGRVAVFGPNQFEDIWGGD